MKLYREFTTQDEIDQQYNVETAIADPKRWFDFFVNESAAARDDLECRLDVPFGPTVEETLDIFPADNPDAPILVFIHGGYWRRLSSKEFSLVARGPVARGVTVVVTNYALCPRVGIGEITRQSRAAVAWIKRTTEQFNGNRSRLFVAGHSAGGQQVARLLETDWVGDYGLAADTVRGGFAISGLFDLRPLRYSWLQPMLQLDVETVRRESPLFHLPDAAPPLVASVGGDESDEFHRQSQSFVERWQAAGLDGEYRVQAGKHHFSVIAGLAEADSPLCDEVMAFIARCEGS